jgi:hypothetical protein
MGSVSSTNPGVADLLQILSGSGSTTGVQTALQSASAGDIVQLSQEALQLQVASGLFGTSQSAETATSPANLLLQAVNSSLTGSTTTATAAAASSASQEVSALLGPNTTNGTVSFSG